MEFCYVRGHDLDGVGSARPPIEENRHPRLRPVAAAHDAVAEAAVEETIVAGAGIDERATTGTVPLK